MSRIKRKSSQPHVEHSLGKNKRPNVAQARQGLAKHPDNPVYRKVLADALLRAGQLDEASDQFNLLIEGGHADHEVYGRLSEVEHRLGHAESAEALLIKALDAKPDYAEALHGMAYLLHKKNQNKKALPYIESACKIQPKNVVFISFKAIVLVALYRYSEALACYEEGLSLSPNDPALWNNYGNALNDLGFLDESIEAYKKAMAMPNATPLAFSNFITTVHYHPGYTGDDITALCRKWNDKYASKLSVKRQDADDKRPEKVIRVGMVSDGFRNHPVGQMTVSTLEACYGKGFDFYFYSTSNHVDYITERFKSIASAWFLVDHLDDEGVAEKIKQDRIDVLIDLSGHNSGNKVMAMAMEPAPVIVKWVGGLINTTGIEAMDYLISDGVETPKGVDEKYVEKLIRLPDDYICYTPPPYLPSVSSLPAVSNGYVTFGCFNNAKKINEEILRCWASIMRELPNSRLFLKSLQFDSPELRERVESTLVSLGISRDRLCIEGPSAHIDLLAAYQKVDIALDPWPYSGGLTTCEAFLMGVPVVSLPGPTFAGRHSATHLVNAGMPELVVNSWEEYRERVLELAADLDSMATIRQHLRQVLLESPVCDAPRFASNFATALRAIWQRHCEGKAPVALTFDKEGRATFEGESEPVEIIEPEASGAANNHFRWNFTGKVIALDNGAKLMRSGAINSLAKLGAFSVVAFDPASQVANHEHFANSEDVQLFRHASLGNGEPATLYATLDPASSATLEPLPAEHLEADQAKATQVLTQLPVNTVSLDSIEGLESLDWLILDDRSDAMAILENGARALKDTLLLQVRLAFQPTHRHQPDFAQVSHWASRHGFRFYRFNDERHRSHLPESVAAEQRQATELESAEALYLPSHERMAKLDDNQKTKLAFLLHTVYGVKDLTYSLMVSVSPEKAERYLQAEDLVRVEALSKNATPDDKENHAEPLGNESGFDVPDAPFMSQSERKLFRKYLHGATRYFEFGSGGSTVWAVEQGLTVHGVESDDKWVSALKGKLGDSCQVQAVDIGPTGEWGYPLSVACRDKFPAYSRAIHEHDTGFDLILVDGRFRVACTLSAIEHILSRNHDAEKARVFIHDFWNRPQYNPVLEFLEQVESVESAGVFCIKPGVDTQKLRNMWHEYAHQPS